MSLRSKELSSFDNLNSDGGGGGNRTHVRNIFQSAAYVRSLRLSSEDKTISFCKRKKPGGFFMRFTRRFLKA